MKLGTQTASLVNHLYSRAVIGQPEPVVGMGATVLSWTDRHAATIVSVGTQRFKGKDLVAIVVQEDRATVVKGSCHDGSAEYEYAANPDGWRNEFVRGDDGKWFQVGRNILRYDEFDKPVFSSRLSVKKNGPGLRIGERQEHYDPSF